MHILCFLLALNSVDVDWKRKFMKLLQWFAVVKNKPFVDIWIVQVRHLGKIYYFHLNMIVIAWRHINEIRIIEVKNN